MSDRSDFNDMAIEAGGGAVAEVISAAIQSSKSASAASKERSTAADLGCNWPDPILPGQLPVPEIPADVLPSWVRDMVQAVAESTQTPSAMAVMLSLAAATSPSRARRTRTLMIPPVCWPIAWRSFWAGDGMPRGRPAGLPLCPGVKRLMSDSNLL